MPLWAGESASGEFMERDYYELLDVLLDKTLILVRRSSEFFYSGWEDVEEALDDLTPLVERVKKRDIEAIKELEEFFAPASRLQDLAVDNGWEDKYAILSDRFEKIVKRLRR